MADFDVAVRRHDGSIERYRIENALTWKHARDYALAQLTPPPRCVLVSERRPSDREPDLRPAA